MVKCREQFDPKLMKISLQDFIISGELGPIRLGMSRTEVEKQLGKADDWSTSHTNQQFPAIWKYGNVELHFGDDDKVEMIFLDGFRSNSDKIDLWILNDQLFAAELEDALKAKHIDYIIQSSETNQTDLLIITVNHSIEFHFSTTDGGSQQLSAVSQSIWHARSAGA